MAIKSVSSIDNTQPPDAMDNSQAEQDIKDFVKAEIDSYIGSQRYSLLLDSHKYYENDNTEIMKRSPQTHDAYGNQVEDKKKSNYKIAHPFVNEMVEQKLNFLFNSNPTVDGKQDENFFNNRHMKILRELATNAILEGLTWSHITYNERGELEEIPITALEIIPFWKDNRSNMLEGLIRFYTIDKYAAGKKTLRMLIEYYELNKDESGFIVHFYYRDIEKKAGKSAWSDNLYNDYDRQYYTFRLIKPAGDDFKELHFTYDRIPYVPYRYNSKGIPLLKFMKPAIDAYDLVISELINSVPDSMKRIDVVEGYGATNIAKFIESMSKYSVVLTDKDGKYQAVFPQINVELLKVAIAEAKENIYNSGNGVDVKSLIASNTSFETIRLRFDEVLQDVRNIAREFSGSLELVYQYYQLDGQIQDFKETLNNITNETPEIDTGVTSADVPDFMLNSRNDWETIKWSVMLPADLELILKLSTIISRGAVLDLINRMNLGIDIDQEKKLYEEQQASQLEAYRNMISSTPLDNLHKEDA